MTYKPLFVSGTCLQGSDNKENQTHGVSFACDTAPAFLQTRQGLGTSRTRMTSSSERQGSSKIRNVLAAGLTSRESNWKESSRNCSFIPAACQAAGCKPSLSQGLYKKKKCLPAAQHKSKPQPRSSHDLHLPLLIFSTVSSVRWP